MPNSGRFYGPMVPSPCYHESPRCPVIKHSSESGKAEIRVYASEAAATGAGHIRRCRLCLGKKVYAIKDDSVPVHITDKQHEVLKIIAGLYSKKKPMTLRLISEKRSRSVVSTYLIVKKLRADGLVEHKLKMGGQRASGRSIAPTVRGLALLKSGLLVDDSK